jgi:hypothetical protein
MSSLDSFRHRLRRRKKRRQQLSLEAETGWPPEGGRPFGHPDDVLSPSIRIIQVFGMLRRDTRERGLWFKIAKVLAYFVFAMIVAWLVLHVISLVST